MVYVGIDPGLGGALAVIATSGRIIVTDTPVLTIKVGKSKKQIMDNARAVGMIIKVLDHAKQGGHDLHVFIEKVNAMPAIGGRSIGATSAFNFGMGYGIWQGILSALKIPYTLVVPVRWKKATMPDANKEKGASIMRVKQLYPHIAEQFKRKKDHGRADAVLIATYGRMTMMQEVPVSTVRTSRRATPA